jgi:hypothetical protein
VGWGRTARALAGFGGALSLRSRRAAPHLVGESFGVKKKGYLNRKIGRWPNAERQEMPCSPVEAPATAIYDLRGPQTLVPRQKHVKPPVTPFTAAGKGARDSATAGQVLLRRDGSAWRVAVAPGQVVLPPVKAASAASTHCPIAPFRMARYSFKCVLAAVCWVRRLASSPGIPTSRSQILSQWNGKPKSKESHSLRSSKCQHGRGCCLGGTCWLERFREDMAAKVSDLYTVLLREKKLPLQLLEDPDRMVGGKAARAGLLATQPFGDTFGPQRRRKRPKLAAEGLEALVAHAEAGGEKCAGRGRAGIWLPRRGLIWWAKQRPVEWGQSTRAGPGPGSCAWWQAPPLHLLRGRRVA